jgi:hypothetical protein
MFERGIHRFELDKFRSSLTTDRSLLYTMATQPAKNPDFKGQPYNLRPYGSLRLTEEGVRGYIPSRLETLGSIQVEAVGTLLDVLANNDSQMHFNPDGVVVCPRAPEKVHHKPMKRAYGFHLGDLKISEKAIRYHHHAALTVDASAVYAAIYMLYCWGFMTYQPDLKITAEPVDCPTVLFLFGKHSDTDWTNDLGQPTWFTVIPVQRASSPPQSKNCIVCGKWTTTDTNLVPLCSSGCKIDFLNCNFVIRHFGGPMGYNTCIMCNRLFLQDRRVMRGSTCVKGCSSKYQEDDLQALR